MSDYESMRGAEEVIAAAERGDYDAQLGISHPERALLIKVEGGDSLSVADIKALTAMGRPDLIDAAYRADRINLEEN